jgi:hypothetical protein
VTHRDRDSYRAGPPAKEKVAYCLERLEEAEGEARGTVPTHGTRSAIAPGLVLDEVIGALLHAYDDLDGDDDGERETHPALELAAAHDPGPVMRLTDPARGRFEDPPRPLPEKDREYGDALGYTCDTDGKSGDDAPANGDDSDTGGGGA